jgi:WD40 repeat protein
MRRWDVPSRTELTPWPTTSPSFLAVSPDGQTLASTHPLSPLAPRVDSFHVVLWDTPSGEQRRRLGDCAEFFAGIAFSPDGQRLAALGNQNLWVWELPSGRAVVRRPSKKFYTGLAFSPDGRVLATSGNDGVVRLWEGRTGELRQAFNWNIGKVLCLAFSADGMRAAAGGSQGDVVIWDVE